MAAARPLPLFVRVTRSEEVFGFSRATAYRWAAKGAFRIYPRGGLAFLKVEEVMAYLEGASQGPAENGGKGEGKSREAA